MYYAFNLNVSFQNQSPVFPKCDVTLHEWAGAYLEFSRSKFCEKVVKEKESVFRRFFDEVDSQLIVGDFANGLGKITTLQYIMKQKSTRSGYAANKDRKNLVAAWNWGIKYLNLPANNPCAVEKMNEIRMPRYIPPEEDFWKVYNICNAPDKMLLLTFLHTAARKSEIFRLCWDDIDFENNTIRLGTRKRAGGTLEYDLLPMTYILAGEMKKHRERSFFAAVFASPCGQPFIGRKKFMSAVCRRAKVKPFGYHAIRHLTATTLYHNGCDLAVIQRILRHRSARTTERYLHSLELKKVKEALDSLHYGFI